MNMATGPGSFRPKRGVKRQMPRRTAKRAIRRLSQTTLLQPGVFFIPFNIIETMNSYSGNLLPSTNFQPADYPAFSVFNRLRGSRWIFSCKSVIAYKSCSGRGGHPGTYTSTGITWFTP